MRRSLLVLLAVLLAGAGVLWVLTTAAKQHTADAEWDAKVAEARRILADPDTAMVLAMLDAGVNPGCSTPMCRNIRARARDTVYMAVLNEPDVLADSQRWRGAMAKLIRDGAAGGRIFGGWSIEQLRALAQRVRASDRTQDPGGAMLAQLLPDDATSEALYVVGRHSGDRLSETFGERSAHTLCIQYRSTVQSERQGVYVNCFEYLVDKAP